MSEPLSSDTKQFFRILVSGYVCLLYFGGILLTYSSLPQEMSSQPHDLPTLSSFIGIALSSFVLSIPIGFLIHESDVFVYRELYRWIYRRVWRHDYTWIDVMRKYLVRTRKARSRPKKDSKRTLGRENCEAFLESARYQDTKSWQADAHLVKEVSNRWSYFYARLEAGIYAPAFAAVLAWITMRLFRLPPVFTTNRIVAGAIAITFISVLLVGYCPRLMKEIDAIETLIVLRRRDRIRTFVLQR